MHLPVIDLLYLCNLCRTPRAAREVVSKFNAEKRFPDRRVILALQYLVEEGVLLSPHHDLGGLGRRLRQSRLLRIVNRLLWISMPVVFSRGRGSFRNRATHQSTTR